MVVSCSFCGEQYGVTEDVTFHKFPANEERRKKWLNAVQRGTWTPGKRSMLCSKHFSRDKFVYKISGDKIRRYLMPDTVPTIFETTSGKSIKGPSQQLETSGKASSSKVNDSTNLAAKELNSVPKPSADKIVTDIAVNSSGSLNLEILAATSVALQPFLITTTPGSIHVEKETTDPVPKSIETPIVTQNVVASCSPNSLEVKAQNQQKRILHFPRTTKRTYHAMQIQTDLTSFPKRSRQVYPGDFKQLNYNDVTEVSKSWTVLNNYIKKMRTNMKVLRQRNRRLEKRVTDLKSVVKFLKNRIVTRDSAAVQLCGHFDSSVTTEVLPEKKQLCRMTNPLGDHDYTSVNDKPLL